MSQPTIDPSAVTCPLPSSRHDRIALAHGGGGKMTADLIQRVFLPAFDNEILGALEDQATLDLPLASDGQSSAPRLAFSTDAFVVRPLFFPGGDIGRLAVYGTVNDLAVGGAIPQYLSAAFILEEGTPIEMVQRIADSMREACRRAKVQLVAGDTKVVDRGKGDQVFITTAGIGFVPPGRTLSIRNIRPGDRILLSGSMGDHGVAVMSVREGLEFETELASDCAPLTELTEVLLAACAHIRWMRDPTRGGVATALNEAAVAANCGIRIFERSLPVRPAVRAACEMLGLDPLYVANEGKLLAIVPAEKADALLSTMRGHSLGAEGAMIGEVVADHPGMVAMKSLIGGERIVPLLSGEQLPRIC